MPTAFLFPAPLRPISPPLKQFKPSPIHLSLPQFPHRQPSSHIPNSLQTPPCPTPPSPLKPPQLPPTLTILTPLLLILSKSLPAFALATSLLQPEATGFIPALTAAFLLVLASEIGDKTFFISALLSMKYSRALVLLGTMLALAAMTIISVTIGQIFHALPASLNSRVPFDDYAAVALLLWFGYQNIRDGLSMRPDEDDELQDAKDVVAAKGKVRGLRVVAETSSVVFLAEWGDKSMLATVALAAAKSPWGVIVGGISGHFVASVIAVLGGSFLGRFISERSARLVGGVLFLVFAVTTLFGKF